MNPRKRNTETTSVQASRAQRARVCAGSINVREGA